MSPQAGQNIFRNAAFEKILTSDEAFNMIGQIALREGTMLDEQLFDALKQVKHASVKGDLCILKPESDSDEHRKSFDYLVLRVKELSKLGYVTNMSGRRDTRIGKYGYYLMSCTITYQGEKVLSYEDFDAYEKALSKSSASPVVNNITIVRDAINSNIISGSNNKMK